MSSCVCKASVLLLSCCIGFPVSRRSGTLHGVCVKCWCVLQEHVNAKGLLFSRMLRFACRVVIIVRARLDEGLLGLQSCRRCGPFARMPGAAFLVHSAA